MKRTAIALCVVGRSLLYSTHVCVCVRLRVRTYVTRSGIDFTVCCYPSKSILRYR